MRSRPAPVTKEAARALAGDALAFLAADPRRLVSFMQLTGLSPDELRRRADDDGLLASVLEHLLADESLLLVFAAERGIDPGRVAPSAMLLQV